MRAHIRAILVLKRIILISVLLAQIPLFIDLDFAESGIDFNLFSVSIL